MRLQGEVAYTARTAVEMQKYVVLVTDVPLAAARNQVAREVEQEEEEASRSASGAMAVTESAAALRGDGMDSLSEVRVRGRVAACSADCVCFCGYRCYHDQPN